jgi:hypothetical protein
MTSAEIKARRMEPRGVDYVPLWLKEIAYQLAVMNERNVKKDALVQDSEDRRFKSLIAQSQAANDAALGKGWEKHVEPAVGDACLHQPLGPECGFCYRRRTMQ